MFIADFAGISQAIPIGYECILYQSFKRKINLIGSWHLACGIYRDFSSLTHTLETSREWMCLVNDSGDNSMRLRSSLLKSMDVCFSMDKCFDKDEDESHQICPS